MLILVGIRLFKKDKIRIFKNTSFEHQEDVIQKKQRTNEGYKHSNPIKISTPSDATNFKEAIQTGKAIDLTGRTYTSNISR